MSLILSFFSPSVTLSLSSFSSTCTKTMEDGTHRRPGPTAETAQIGMQDCCLGVLSSSGAAGAACFSYCRMLELVLLLPPPLLILGGGRERRRWSRVFGEEGAHSLGTKEKIERAWAARNGSSSSSTSGSSSHNPPRASSSRVGVERFNLQNEQMVRHYEQVSYAQRNISTLQK